MDEPIFKEAPAVRAAADVRMRGFSHRATVQQVLAWLDQQPVTESTEMVATIQAAGRVLCDEICSSVDVPGFDRAMMDGYAVQARDTAGASMYNRLPLMIVGQSMPSVGFSGEVQRGQAVRIMTGAPLPAGADAVLPAEEVTAEQDRILASGEVPPGKHVGRRGEDLRAGAVMLRAGRRLRPQDIGLLVSTGVVSVPVRRRTRVRIVSTGNELLPPGSLPTGYQIVDSNSSMLTALVVRDGGEVVAVDRVPDQPSEILAAMRSSADIVLVSGGSSVGQEDHAPVLVAEHGELAIHGVAMRPSSPVGMGRLDGRLVFLLPGNPVSCLCAYDFFAGRMVRQFAGLSPEWPYRQELLPLANKLVSMIGRVDYARVTMRDGAVIPLAIGGASMLSSTTVADGFVIIPADSEGYPAGHQVRVYCYDGPTTAVP